MANMKKLLLLCFLLAAGVAYSQQKVALVVGNNSYKEYPLKNAGNDAQLMTTTLQKLGFTVQQALNKSKADLEKDLATFNHNYRNADIRFFYYAGHGIQFDGDNYLIPVDATLEDKVDVRLQGINFSTIFSMFQDSKPGAMNIFIMDACRNNPFKNRSWGSRGGDDRGLVLKKTDFATGSFAAFSADNGQKASDGEGNNGLYTQVLAETLLQPGVEINIMFQRIRSKVVQLSHGDQTPVEENRLVSDNGFYFIPTKGDGPSPTPVEQVIQRYYYFIDQNGKRNDAHFTSEAEAEANMKSNKLYGKVYSNMGEVFVVDAPVKPVNTDDQSLMNKDFNFFDDFSNNGNNWQVPYDADKEISVTNGKITIKGKNDKYGYQSTKDFPDIDVSKDFTAKVTIKWIAGATDRGFGLNYCTNIATNSLYTFFITAGGFYSIRYLENGAWKDVKPWTKSDYINQNSAPNIISIKKVGSTMSFFVNDRLLDSFPFYGGFGHGFGFQNDNIQTVEFDNFELTGTKTNTSFKQDNPYNQPLINKGFNFFDDFSNNTNNWLEISDADKEMGITNGKYILKGKSDRYGYQSLKDFPDIDLHKDFTAKVTARWVEGIKDRGFGLNYCGNLSTNSMCAFFIDANGYYAIRHLENGAWKDIKDWAQSSYINQNGIPNIISIKKTGSTISFYVNDHLLESFPFDGGYGGGFGFREDNVQTIEFDDFELIGARK